MKKIKTKLDGVYIIEPTIFNDQRGWFSETYSKLRFENLGLYYDFVQDNHSFSARKGTLRGIHFQTGEKSQAKLVRVTKGKVIDVAIDLRENSPNYKEWIAVELSAENNLQLLIPRGFGHGFVTLTDNVELQYKVDNYFSLEHDGSLYYADEEIGINWGIKKPILSSKDKNAPKLRELGVIFK